MLRLHFCDQTYFDVRRNMISSETHFKLNRILLFPLGLWPYQKPENVRLQVTLIFGILMCSIIFQLGTLMTSECTLDYVIKVSSTTLIHITGGIQYISFWIHRKTMRYFLEYMRNIYNELKDENEIAILESYGRSAKRYVTGITLFGISAVLTLIAQILWEQKLDIFLFINETRSHFVVQTATGFFAKRKNDWCLILLHTSLSISITLAVSIATGGMFIEIIFYVCGMFNIASYRVEQAININYKNRNNISPMNEIIINKEIAYAVDIHRKAIECSKSLATRFEVMFFSIAILGVISLSLHLYCINKVVLFGDEDKTIFWNIIDLIYIIIYMFIANYMGQIVTDHYYNIFFTAYKVRWYVMPLSIQKLIVLLLQRGNKTFILDIGKLFATSLKGFTTLINTSMSYFTFMYSAHQRS